MVKKNNILDILNTSYEENCFELLEANKISSVSNIEFKDIDNVYEQLSNNSENSKIPRSYFIKKDKTGENLDEVIIVYDLREVTNLFNDTKKEQYLYLKKSNDEEIKRTLKQKKVDEIKEIFEGKKYEDIDAEGLFLIENTCRLLVLDTLISETCINEAEKKLNISEVEYFVFLDLKQELILLNEIRKIRAEQSIYLTRDKNEQVFRLEKSEKIYSGNKDSYGTQRIKVDGSGLNYLKYERNLKSMSHLNNIINIEEISAENLELDAIGINATLYDIFKIYNIRGNQLFKYNVRVGKTDLKSRELRRTFSEIIGNSYMIYLNNNLQRNNCLDDKLTSKENQFLEEISNKFDLELKWNSDKKIFEVDSEELEPNLSFSDLFWFYHNGITMYTEKKVYKHRNQIFLDPFETSVINGAQTLTHCFDIFFELEQFLLDNKRDKEIENEFFMNSIIDSLEDVSKSLFIKLYIIHSDQYFVNDFTYGLNNQLPVEKEHLVRGNEVFKEINEIIYREGMYIIKDGEVKNHTRMSVLDFLKKYYMFIGKPGYARNYPKSTKMDEDSREILENMKNGESNFSLEEFRKAVDLFESIDLWWRKRIDASDEIGKSVLIKDEEEYRKNIKQINSNSKFYFKSYCYLYYVSNTEFIDDSEFLSAVYIELIRIIIVITEDENSPIDYIDSNAFKNDALFNMIKKYKKEAIKENEKDYKNEQDNYEKNLVQQYNEFRKKTTSKASLYQFLQNYETESFRTIIIDKNIEGDLHISEHIPLPSNTFSDIYMKFINEFRDEKSENIDKNFGIDHKTEIDDSIEYYINKFTNGEEEGIEALEKIEDSTLYKELNKSIKLYIAIRELSSGEVTKVFNVFDEDFKFIKIFNEKEYEEVYFQTLSAFKNASVEELPKVSDNKAMHVRPKARNSDDTFVFTDYSHITKRTFWINSDFLLEYLEREGKLTNV